MAQFNLKSPVEFEGIKGLCYGRVLGLRRPRKGEFYLSGAIMTAYKASNDLSGHFHVVVPTHRAIPAYKRGAIVDLSC